MICPESQEPVKKDPGFKSHPALQSLSEPLCYTPQLLSWFLIYAMCSQLDEHVASGISFYEFAGVHVISVQPKNKKAHSLQTSLL